MISRSLLPEATDALAHSLAVVMPGPQQVGKTTLALEIGRALGTKRPTLQPDLESEADRAKVSELELYLPAGNLDKLVVLDEVHRSPGLLAVLRDLIDKARQAGQRHFQIFCRRPSCHSEVVDHSGQTASGLS